MTVSTVAGLPKASQSLKTVLCFLNFPHVVHIYTFLKIPNPAFVRFDCITVGLKWSRYDLQVPVAYLDSVGRGRDRKKNQA